MAKVKLPKGGSVTAHPKKQEPIGLSLYQIDAEMTLVQQLINTADGELTEDQDKYYTQLLESAKKKADGYIATIRYVEGQVELAKQIIKEADAKMKRWKNIADSLRERLCTFMGNQRIAVIKPDNPTLPCVYWNAGRPKLDIDAEKLPPEYTVPGPAKPDRDKIEEAIASGKSVDGVTPTVGADYLVIR